VPVKWFLGIDKMGSRKQSFLLLSIAEILDVTGRRERQLVFMNLNLVISGNLLISSIHINIALNCPSLTGRTLHEKHML
jgi:hypothetical protein